MIVVANIYLLAFSACDFEFFGEIPQGLLKKVLVGSRGVDAWSRAGKTQNRSSNAGSFLAIVELNSIQASELPLLYSH